MCAEASAAAPGELRHLLLTATHRDLPGAGGEPRGEADGNGGTTGTRVREREQHQVRAHHPRPGRMAVVGARSRAEKCAGVHISGPFSVTVPLHITSNLSRLTRGQQCPALAQHGAIGSPPPTRRPTKEPKPPQTNTGEMRGHGAHSVGRTGGVIASPRCAFIEEDARLSLELRDSFAFLDCQDAWLEHGDGDAAARAALGHGGLGDSDGYPAIEEGMESGFMNVSWSVGLVPGEGMGLVMERMGGWWWRGARIGMEGLGWCG